MLAVSLAASFHFIRFSSWGARESDKQTIQKPLVCTAL